VKFFVIIQNIFKSFIEIMYNVSDIIKINEIKDLDVLHDHREKIKKEKDGKRS